MSLLSYFYNDNIYFTNVKCLKKIWISNVKILNYDGDMLDSSNSELGVYTRHDNKTHNLGTRSSSSRF